MPPSLLAADIAKGRLEAFTRAGLNQFVDAPGATSDRALAANSLLKLMFTTASGERTHRAIRNSIGTGGGRTADFIRREEDRLLAELARGFVADSRNSQPELTGEPAPLLMSLALREVSDCAGAIIDLYERYCLSDRATYLHSRPAKYGEPPVPKDALACFARLEEVMGAYVAIRDSLYMRKGSAVAEMIYRLDGAMLPPMPDMAAQPPSAAPRLLEVIPGCSPLPSAGPYVPDVWLAWWSLRHVIPGIIAPDEARVSWIDVHASRLACLAASINEATLEQQMTDAANSRVERFSSFYLAYTAQGK